MGPRLTSRVSAPPAPATYFGPGTRVPALLIAKGFNRSGVDHTVYDTASIMATIEHQFDLKPVAARGGVVPRDRFVDDLANAVDAGRKGH